MPNATRTDATQILKEWSEGDKNAPARLMPLIYEELRGAAEYLRHERPDHALQATALVHEAYLKLIDQGRVDWKTSARNRMRLGAQRTSLRSPLFPPSVDVEYKLPSRPCAIAPMPSG